MKFIKILVIIFTLIFLIGGNGEAQINSYNRNGGVYYGWPISVNGSSTVDQATSQYSNWQFIVFGEDNATNSLTISDLRQIMSNLHNPGYNTKCYAYVSVGSNAGNGWRTLQQVTNLMRAWYTNYGTNRIDGFFLDEFSYDWGATRHRQNVAIDKAHNWGMNVIVNGWFPDHCLGLTDDPSYPNSIYNPSLEPSHISNGDYYTWENWVWAVTNDTDPATWNDKDQWKNKTYKVMDYQKQLGIKVLAISVEEANFNQFGTASSRVHEDFAFWCVLGAGFENFQFSEYYFSSGNDRLYWYDNLNNVTNNVGTNYVSDLQEVTNGIFYRYTDTGVIRLDWNTHTGSFIPLGPDTNAPTFATNNFVPVNGETGVSFSVDVYIEIDDDRGVLYNSLNVQINGTNAITNGVFLPLFNGPGSKIVSDDAGGYNIYIDRTNLYGINSSVDVKVWGCDGASNWSTNIFSFTTGDTNSCITFDGDLSDWPGYAEWNIDSRDDMTNDKAANILRNYIFDGVDKAKSTNLYIAYIQESTLNNGGNYGHQIYFDVDNNSSTGNTNAVWWQSFGAEYYVEFYTLNDSLEYCEGVKKWTNGSWQNTGVMPDFGVSGNKIEIGISLSKLGIADKSNIGLTMASYSTNWVDMDANNGEGESKYVYTMHRKICPDTTPPTFATNNFDPLSGESNVSFRADIYIEIDDDGLVASNTINVQINGTNAIVNGVFQPLFSGSNSSIVYDGSGGYNITIDRTNDLGPYATVDVKVWASDMYGNSSTNIYTFTTGGTNQCIVADGDLSDWPGYAIIDSDTRYDSPLNNSAVDIVKNYIYDGAGANMVTNLYFAFKERASLNDGNQYEHLIYIDSDRNSSTGDTSAAYWVYPVMGADYKIDFYTQNDMVSYIEDIYYWNGSSWVSTGHKPQVGVSGDSIEVIVPINYIGHPTSSVDVTFASLNTNYNPDSNNDNNKPAITYTFYHGFCEDTEPPTFATNNFFPANGETGVSFSVSPYIEIDDNAGVASNKISVKINGNDAIINGVFQPGYDGPDSKIVSDGSGGMNVTIDLTTDFSPNQYVTVQVIAGDFQNNYATNTYSFITGDTNVCITIDGDLSDWGGYAKIKMDPAGDNAAVPGSDIIRAYYVDGSTAAYVSNIYVAFKFKQTQNDGYEHVNDIFIDADNNTSTGHTTSPWFTSPIMGAEYLIEVYTLNDAIAYKALYTNDGANWLEAGNGGAIQAAVSSNVLEVAIPTSILSKITGSTLNLAFASARTDWATEDDVPDSGNPAIKYGMQYKHCIDTEPPFLANSDPKDGSLGFSPDWDIKVWLNDNTSVVSNTVIIRIDEDGAGTNVHTAFSNGAFLTNYATGGISPWQNGWYILINPNNNLPKSSFVIVSVYAEDMEGNVCDTNFSFTTAYTTYNPPPPPPPGINKPLKQGGIYYGWPTFSEGGKDEWDNPESEPPYHNAEVADVWDDYYYIVLGFDLVDTTYHTAEWSNTKQIIDIVQSNPTNKTKIFGYIAIGCTENWTLSEITNFFNRWLEFNVDGIFWDEFGYDYASGCSLRNNYRARQNAVVDLTHSHGLIAIANAWWPDHVFGTNNDPAYPNSTYNPSLLQDHFQAGDMFCNESFFYANGSYWSGADLTFQINKAYQCMDLEKTRGIKSLALSTEPSGSEWGDFDTASSIKAQIYTFYSMLLFGLDYYYFSDYNYSAGSTDNYMYYLPDWDGATGFPSDWYPYVGTMYTSDVNTNSTSPLILERCTDYGRIWVNFTSYTGGFDKFTTYYVNSDPSIGNNGYTAAQAQNEITPWLTIGHAISNASAGDIIKVKGSTTYPYQESVKIGVSGGGFCFDYIQIVGYGDEPVVLDGQNSLAYGIIFTNNSSRVKIENIEIKNYTDAGIYITQCGSSNLIIKDCNIHHNGNYGIRVRGTKHTIENNSVWSNGGGGSDAGIFIDSDCADDSLVHRNRVYQNNGYGIYNNGGDNNEIANNKVYNNSSYGIYLANNADNNGVSLNTVYKNGGRGICITSSSGTIVQNNTSVKQQYGYYFDSTATVKNNISYSNSNTGYYSTVAQTVTYSISHGDANAVNANVNGGNFLSGTGCMTNNPLFSDESVDDYRLQYTSPAINKGSPTTQQAAIGGTVTSVKLQNSIPGDYVANTNTFTIYAKTDIPADAQICFSYPPGFNISGAKLVSKSFDGGAYISIYLNEIAIVRDGTGTAISAGTSVKVVLTNIMNSGTPGGQTIQWYIKNANGEIIMGPQQSNDIYILEPFAIIGKTPAAGATNVAYNSTVDVYFSQPVNTNTLSTNTFYVTDDMGKKVPGVFTMISSNAVRFTPTISLPANGVAYVTVTTDLEATTTQTLLSNNSWSFTVGPGNITPHSYNTISLDATVGDWDKNNYVTADKSLRENIAHDSDDPSPDVCATTNLWVTWDSNYLYFRIDKNNAGNDTSLAWKDIIGIDITLDDRGADVYINDEWFDCPDWTFTSPRKPEFIIEVPFNYSYYWESNASHGYEYVKYDGTNWNDITSGNLSTSEAANRSDVLEVRIPITSLSNRAYGETGIPNRIAVRTWTRRYNSPAESDFCPEDGSWITVDIDNNGDDIPDRLPPMSITYQNPAPNGQCGINDNIWVGFSANIDASTVNTNTIWVEYNGSKVAGSFTVVGTNIIFDPSSAMIGGETYTVWVTLDVRSVNGQAIPNITSWNFTPVPGPKTPHHYNYINCDHDASDWNSANYVTWNSNRTEYLTNDAGDSGHSQITNFWLTWDNSKVYFRLDMLNGNGYRYQDFIAIDVSRDGNGADSFTCTNQGGGTASHTFTFSGNEKPEFIISLHHDETWDDYFTSMELRKWTGSNWVQVGTLNTHFGYQGTIANSSDFVECWILASFLTNGAVGVTSGIPNRIKVKAFMYNNSDPSVDFCPEDGSWIEVHPDNNGDDILDDMSLNIISRSPDAGETGVALNANISVIFDSSIDNTTVSTSTFYVMYNGSKISGSFTVVGTNVIFNPTADFNDGGVYTVYVTTGVKSTGGETLLSTNSWSFTAGTPLETEHCYNTITLDAATSDWDKNNYVTADKSLTENIAHDSGDTPSNTATTNFWVTWDSNYLYFRIDKNNAGNYGSSAWKDIIGIDITLDDRGADVYINDEWFDCPDWTFTSPRKPEFIIEVPFAYGNEWQASASYGYEYVKYDGANWNDITSGNLSTSEAANRSDVLEVRIPITSLSNRAYGETGIPNKIAVRTWGYVYNNHSTDYCPEDESWITIDLDNNDDDIPDENCHPLNVIATTPSPNETGVSLTTSISCAFNQWMDTNTFTTNNFYVLSSDGQKINGSFTTKGTNYFVFTLSSSLEPNEFYSATVTTGIMATNGSTLNENYVWHFYTTNGNETSHCYSEPDLNADMSDWYNSNNVTYNNTLGERIVQDLSEDGGVSATTNLWMTWSSNRLYFAVVKNNNGTSSANWIDYIAFDITRNNQGATNYNDADTGTVNFQENRLPEFILEIPHNLGGNNWDYNNTRLWKYTTNWSSVGSAGVDFKVQTNSYNNSQILEGWISFDTLTNNDVPNRLAVLEWSASGGSVQDYAPEMTTTQNASNKYWVTIDCDNNGDSVADGSACNIHIIQVYPTNMQTNVVRSTNIYIKFDSTINNSTVSTTTVYLQDSDFNKVAGSFTVSGSNVTFAPTLNLKPNEFYTVTVTTSVLDIYGHSLASNAVWYFYTEPGITTSHSYNTITLDADESDWDNSNNITYDNSLTENLWGDGASEDGTAAYATTNIKITWDANKLYFAILKLNSGSSGADWYDFLAFDVTRDRQGAERFTNANYCGTVHFQYNRRPEYILQLDHFDLGYRWDRNGGDTKLLKWNGSQWIPNGSIGNQFDIQSESYENSRIVEGWIDLTAFTDENGKLPNRVAVIDFSAVRGGGTVYDFCREMPAPGNTHTWATNKYWLTFDIDNDDDEIPDGSGSGTTLSITKYITNIKLGGANSTSIPGATIEYVIIYSNTGSTAANNVIIYDQIPVANVVYKTDGGGTATGWTVQYSTNTTPDQSWSSSDYTNVLPANKSDIKWIRWIKASVGTNEDGLTLKYAVIIK